MNTQMLDREWSAWHRFDADVEIPDEPGVYEIRTNFEFARLRGSSSLVTIGSAAPSLRKRLCEQRFTNAVRYQNRAEKWLIQAGHVLEFRYTTVSIGKEARYLEAMRLLEYENRHWELPPGNEALPMTVVRRHIEQRLGKFTEQILRDLLHHGSLDEVAGTLGVPPSVVENLIVYWGIVNRQ